MVRNWPSSPVRHCRSTRACEPASGFAAAAAVPLSSVRQPREQLGYAAMELLLDEVETARRTPTGRWCSSPSSWYANRARSSADTAGGDRQSQGASSQPSSPHSSPSHGSHGSLDPSGHGGAVCVGVEDGGTVGVEVGDDVGDDVGFCVLVGVVVGRGLAGGRLDGGADVLTGKGLNGLGDSVDPPVVWDGSEPGVEVVCDGRHGRASPESAEESEESARPGSACSASTPECGSGRAGPVGEISHGHSARSVDRVPTSSVSRSPTPQPENANSAAMSATPSRPSIRPPVSSSRPRVGCSA